MKSKSTSYLLPFVLLILAASCSRKTKVPVPADAAFVLHIDGASLLSKLSWEEFKQGELYRLASEEIKEPLLRKILDNPDSSGIDIKSDAYLFMKVQGRGGYAGFTCPLKDEKAFSNFIAELQNGTPVREGNVSVIKQDKIVLTWSSNRFVMIADNPGMAGGSFGTASKSGSRSFPEDSLAKFAREIYELKGSASVGGNEKFSALLKETGDAHFWLNSGKFYGDALPAMLSVTKIGLLLEGNITAATINFDNGKIAMEGKNYYNKELAELFKKYPSKNLDESLLKKIPSENVAGVIAMNYSPEGLKAFLSLLGIDGLINMYLGEMGYSLDDFVKANKGDIVLAATDFTFNSGGLKPTEAGGEPVYQSSGPSAKFIFATSINDKPSFDKLTNLVQQKVGEAGLVMNQLASKIPYSIQDGWFIAGNDSAFIQSFGKNNSNHSFIGRISGHPMGGFLDIQKFITGFAPAASNDSLAASITQESLKFWQDITFYGGEYKNDALEYHAEINLVDKNTNSLKQLHNYLGRIATSMKEREEQLRAQWDIPAVPDTTMILPQSK